MFEHGGPARVEFAGEDEVATYTRCWIPVAPELEMYGLYIVPKHAKLPAPLIISQHGGGGTPELATFNGGANYFDMVRGAVAEGYIVFAPLMIFNPGSDVDHNSPIPEAIRQRLDARLRLLGTSLTGVETSMVSRALDTLLERPEIQADRVGMVGLSYGGYYTLHTVAVETRIKCAVSSCFFGDQSARMCMDQHDAWSDMRFLGTVTDLADPELVALICPRPLQVQVGRTDELFDVKDSQRMAQRAGEYYRRLGLEERFDFVDFEGGHEWNGPSAWPFLKKWL
jgi:dienelactone hydrolase